MNIIEILKLKRRASRYKNREDKGGIAFLLSVISEGQTVIDIGAHKAAYLYFMIQKIGQSGKAYAFEPQSSLYDYINRIKGYLKWNNLTIEHMALSDSSGTATLFIPTNNTNKSSSPGASIVNAHFEKGKGIEERVQTETLDSYCQKFNISPNFLKIDVEGNELRVFRGGIQTLKQCKPSILVEIEARHAGREKALETFMLLEELGYHGSFIHGNKRRPLNEFDFNAHQNINDKRNYCNNFTFVRPSLQSG